MNLGLADSPIPDTLTFLDDKRFKAAVLGNPNIVAVITTPEIAQELDRPGLEVIEDDNPRYTFYLRYNAHALAERKSWPSVIEGEVHAAAYVSPTNVRIGRGTVVQANATILADVEIGEDCDIGPGAVVGSEGFEMKRTSKGILPVVHDGYVKLGDRVRIGARTCVDKGFSDRPTILGDDVKTDNLVHVAHGVQIGPRTLVTAGVSIAGSVTIGADVWLGVNATISNGLTIGDGAYVSLGSVVTRDVAAGERVTGNFAIPHRAFMRNLVRAGRE